MTDVDVRRGTADDNEPCFRVFVDAIIDLSRRIGAPWEPDPVELWPRLEPMFGHLGEQAAEWWVAQEGDGEVIGYARSVARGGLFELTEFFVRPGRQSAGIGRRLLELAFPPDRGDVRAIIATPDLRALSRYYRAGTTVRFPIVSLTGAPAANDGASDLEVDRATADDFGELAALERAVLDFERGSDELAWLLEQREGYLYRRDGRAVAFGFIGQSGSGPIAALEPADQGAILLHLEARAAALGRPEVSFEVPMVNEVTMRHLLERRFRMDPFMTLLLSSRPFGQFDRFIAFSPPFVL
jgi:GNAT superfamily N-acetyltransferase